MRFIRFNCCQRVTPNGESGRDEKRDTSLLLVASRLMVSPGSKVFYVFDSGKGDSIPNRSALTGHIPESAIAIRSPNLFWLLSLLGLAGFVEFARQRPHRVELLSFAHSNLFPCESVVHVLDRGLLDAQQLLPVRGLTAIVGRVDLSLHRPGHATPMVGAHEQGIAEVRGAFVYRALVHGIHLFVL